MVFEPINSLLEPIKRFVNSQRDALLAGTMLAILLYASGALAAVETRLVASGFTQPVFVGAPEGDPRLFIVEKTGAIKVRQPNGTISTFLNIGASGADLINTSGERGLLGLAFDPNFSKSGQPGFGTFYVNYISSASPNNTVVARFQISSDPDVANLASRQTIITVLQPSGVSNHKAGWIGFRPGESDNLYIATGDGGSSDDPGNRAQSLNDNLGKMLRIDVRGDDFAADANRNYRIPSTNPFVDRAGNDEIWAYGLRNPYRNSFDRETGDLWIGDVGQDNREEINFRAAGDPVGANFGWRLREGMIETPTPTPPDTPVGGPRPDGNVDPVLDYGRSFGASVTGGYVYRGDAVAELEGAYIFGDFITARIWAIDNNGSFISIANARELTAALNPDGKIGNLSSFGEDGFGQLYLVDYSDGQIYMMVPEPGTWGLLAAGVGLLGWRVRRARRA